MVYINARVLLLPRFWIGQYLGRCRKMQPIWPGSVGVLIGLDYIVDLHTSFIQRSNFFQPVGGITSNLLWTYHGTISATAVPIWETFNCSHSLEELTVLTFNFLNLRNDGFATNLFWGFLWILNKYHAANRKHLGDESAKHLRVNRWSAT